ncbi:MAG TPA: signal peptidase II [Tepidisphaeraceae bacterium]|nr:signal peptidase II [Tepidisphaeraceae bacterium]
MPRPADNFRSPMALALFIGTTLIGLTLDLWTKSIAFAQLNTELGSREIEFIPNWLHFTYTSNHGAVFGLGQGQRGLFVVVSIAAIAFLTYLFSLSAGRRFYQFLLGMLLAGVLGNMYDRIAFGYVRDMIHALPGIYWPASIGRYLPAAWANGGVFPWVFNVADMLLCIGVFLMIVYSFIHRPVELAQEEPVSVTELPQAGQNVRNGRSISAPGNQAGDERSRAG